MSHKWLKQAERNLEVVIWIQEIELAARMGISPVRNQIAAESNNLIYIYIYN